jgi:hypothetical protein
VNAERTLQDPLLFKPLGVHGVRLRPWPAVRAQFVHNYAIIAQLLMHSNEFALYQVSVNTCDAPHHLQNLDVRWVQQAHLRRLES